jgi:hypothetical protein
MGYPELPLSDLHKARILIEENKRDDRAPEATALLLLGPYLIKQSGYDDGNLWST